MNDKKAKIELTTVEEKKKTFKIFVWFGTILYSYVWFDRRRPIVIYFGPSEVRTKSTHHLDYKSQNEFSNSI